MFEKKSQHEDSHELPSFMIAVIAQLYFIAAYDAFFLVFLLLYRCL